MIVCKLSSVYRITLPPIVSQVLSTISRVLELGINIEVVTAFECSGFYGYFFKLASWSLAGPIIIVTLLVLLFLFQCFCGKRREGGGFQWDTFGARAVGLGVRVLFLFYPVITTIAFEAFACYTFDAGTPSERQVLVADVDITCWGEYHSGTIVAWAWFAVFLYPVGAIVLTGVLLFIARKALFSKDPEVPHRWLAVGLSFIYREYKPEFYMWELMEMARRFVLVGIFVQVAPGSVMQIVMGTFLSIFYFYLQLSTRPYKKRADEFLAASSSFMLVLCFACCIIFKYNSLLEVIADNLRPEEEELFLLPSTTVGIVLMVFILSSIFLSSAVLILTMNGERRRLQKEAINAANRRLRYVEGGKEVDTQLEKGLDYHLFLSHTWGTGQDQMRIVKQRLLEMCPKLKVFLDVDDLKEIGDLEGYIERTGTVLVFCSEGYFVSKNCMRELLSSVHLDKRIIPLLEMDSKRGGLQHGEIREQLEHAEDLYQEWGLRDKIERDWGWEFPIADKVYDALFHHQANEWNRIGDFQDVTLRLIMECSLSLPVASTYIAGALQYNATLVLPPPQGGKDFHVFCSAHNPGAVALMQELAIDKTLEISISQDPDELPECSKMLVYLTARTWLNGARSDAFAKHVKMAMDHKVELLLAHEMPGEGQENRFPIEFSKFFADETADPGGTETSTLDIEVGLENDDDSVSTAPKTAQAAMTGKREELRAKRAMQQRGLMGVRKSSITDPTDLAAAPAVEAKAARRLTSIISVVPPPNLGAPKEPETLEFRFETGPPIGVALADEHDNIVIMEVVEGLPAHEQGVPVGAVVELLNGIPVRGLGAAATKAMIAACVGRPVYIVLRVGERQAAGDDAVRQAISSSDDELGF